MATIHNGPLTYLEFCKLASESIPEGERVLMQRFPWDGDGSQCYFGKILTKGKVNYKVYSFCNTPSTGLTLDIMSFVMPEILEMARSVK